MDVRFHVRRAVTRAASPLVRLRDRFGFAERLTAGWPVSSARVQSTSNPFFVIGNPRSGSTLLRAILSLHPTVYVPPENGGIGAMLSAFRDVRRRPWPQVVDAVIAAFAAGYEFEHWSLAREHLALRANALPESRRCLAELFDVIYRAWGEQHAPGKSRWGDKTVPGDCAYLAKLVRVFPDACYVHLVRDGRACVASAVEAGMFGRSYRAAAFAWRDGVRYCRELGATPARKYTEVRYEDLVDAPRATIDALCAFLGIVPTDAMRNYSGARNVGDVDAIAHHQNVRRPLFRDSLAKWRSQIPGPEQASVTRIMRRELALVGYEPSDTAIAPDQTSSAHRGADAARAPETPPSQQVSAAGPTPANAPAQRIENS